MKICFRAIIAATMFFSQVSVAQSAGKTYVLRYLVEEGVATELESFVEASQFGARPTELQERSYFAHAHAEESEVESRIIEVRAGDARALEKIRIERGIKTSKSVKVAAGTVTTFLNAGAPENRIDIVILGDGYTEQERDKFMVDAERLASETFFAEGFSRYLPLLNVHFVFEPSAESGMGQAGAAINTVYGLYRMPGSLRTVDIGKPEAARAACRLAPGCDFPVVIANDPYYGAKAGEFALTTASIVHGGGLLRHGLGHNFGEVGEEYDGGRYYGANHTPPLDPISWGHWLRSPETDDAPQPSELLFLDWPWINLQDGPMQRQFESYGAATASLNFSVKGVQSPEQLAVLVDGEEMAIESTNGSDRTFISLPLANLEAGVHNLEFRELVSDGDNVVASAKVTEYEADYNLAEGFVGAFPLFTRSGGLAGYRPTADMCIMRDHDSHSFCPICSENNWLQLLSRLSLIDDLVMEELEETLSVELRTVDFPVAESIEDDQDHLSIGWWKNGVEQAELSDKLSWSMPKEQAMGSWDVVVKLVSEDIRQDPEGHAETRHAFSIEN